MVKKKASKARAKRIEALSEISKAVISELYLEDILKLIVTVTAEVMHSKICSLLLLDEKKGDLTVKATQSVSRAYLEKPPIRLEEGIAGRVAAEGKAIISKNVKRKEKRYSTSTRKST